MSKHSHTSAIFDNALSSQASSPDIFMSMALRRILFYEMYDQQSLLFCSADTCGESEMQCSDRAVCTENGCCVCNDGHHGNGKMCLKNGT